MCRAARASRVTSPGSRSPCVRAGSPVVAVAHVAVHQSATLPARVTVSSASTTMAQCYTPTGSTRFVRVRRDCPARDDSHLLSAHAPSSASATPAMRQYLDVKRQHRDAIVLFRMGDFYEMFYEDALTAVARARADADVARQGRGRRRDSDVRRARSTRSTRTSRGSCARAIASRSAIRSKTRARPRASSSARSRASSRRARSPTPAYLEAREPAFLAAIAPAGVASAALGPGVSRRLDRRVRGRRVRRPGRGGGARRPSWRSCGRGSCWRPTAPRSTAR